MREGSILAGLAGIIGLIVSASASAMSIATLNDELTSSNIVYETVGVLTEEDFFFQDSFSIDTAGTYTVTLTDLAAGLIEPFEELGLLLTTATEVLFSLDSPGNGTFTYDFNVPELVTAIVFGEVDGDDREFGVFGLEVTVQPVPVPAALPLLLSALVGLGVVGRRRVLTAAHTTRSV